MKVLFLFILFSIAPATWAQITIDLPKNHNRDIHAGVVKQLALLLENHSDSAMDIELKTQSNHTLDHYKYHLLPQSGRIVHSYFNPGENPSHTKITVTYSKIEKSGIAIPSHDNFSFLFNAGNAGNSKLPSVIFDKLIHQYGGIELGPPATCHFKFTNQDSMPLSIKNATTSCGCLVIQFPKNSFEPGESGILTLEYYTYNRPGSFHKTATVEFNNGLYFSLSVMGLVVDPAGLNTFK